MHIDLNIEDQREDLDIHKFAHILDNNNQGYKFFWLHAIMHYISKGKISVTFDELINDMIAEAWYTVTTYHLWLGPRFHENESSNNIEQAIFALNHVCALPFDATKEMIIEAIHEHEDDVSIYKKNIAINVPYRTLSPFLKVDAKDWYYTDKMIQNISEANQRISLPYMINKGNDNVHNTIEVNPNWAMFIKAEYPIIQNWILYSEVQFLQQRNPGVPGIIQKLEPERERKLDDVKKLWQAVLQKKDIIDVYSDRFVNQEKYDIDHFVPWSFVASDELWNLNPAISSENRSKNNHLPAWDKYSKRFIDQQYDLYTLMNVDENIYQLFRKCKKNNLHNKWAVEMLYIPDHDYDTFANILEKNLKVEYDAAYDQGFDIWTK